MDLSSLSQKKVFFPILDYDRVVAKVVDGEIAYFWDGIPIIEPEKQHPILLEIARVRAIKEIRAENTRLVVASKLKEKNQ